MKKAVALFLTVCLCILSGGAMGAEVPEELQQIITEMYSVSTTPETVGANNAVCVFTLGEDLFALNNRADPIKMEGDGWTGYRFVDSSTGELLNGSFDLITGYGNAAYGVRTEYDFTSYDSLGFGAYEITPGKEPETLSVRQIGVFETNTDSFNLQTIASDGEDVLFAGADWSVDNYRVLKINIATGKGSEVAKKTDICRIVYDGQRFIALCKDMSDYNNITTPYIAELNKENGKLKKLLELNRSDSVSGLAFDKNTGNFYYMDNTSIYGVPSQMDKAEVCADKPIDIDSLSQLNVCMSGGKYVVCQQYDGEPQFLSVSPSDRKAVRLTIMGSIYDLQDTYAAYEKQSEDTALTFTNKTIYGAEDIKQDMQSDTASDIYMVSSASGALEALTNKGYCADLSSSEIIASFVEKVYPNFTQNGIKDGKIYAIPVQVSCSTMCYYQDALDELDLTEEDMPKTYMEFLEFTERYVNEIMPEYPDKLLLDWGNNGVKNNILSNFIQSQMLYCQSQNMPLTFDTPEVRAFLDKMSAMKPVWDTLASCDDSNTGYTSYDDTGAHHCSIFGGWGYVTPIEQHGSSEGDVLLPLTIYDNQPACLNANVTYAVVNPYSKNVERATELLEFITANLKRETKHTLITTETEPYETEEYLMWHGRFQTGIDKMREGLENADEADKALWQQYLDGAETQMGYFERNRWMISPEQMERYQKLVPHMIVSASEGFNMNDDSVSKLIKRFRDGQMDTNSFVTEISRILQMIYQEKQ